MVLDGEAIDTESAVDQWGWRRFSGSVEGHHRSGYGGLSILRMGRLWFPNGDAFGLPPDPPSGKAVRESGATELIWEIIFEPLPT